jgi:uncharacterized repeat protein (TIGR03803 family)
MRRKSFWIAASCVLAVVGLRPVNSSGAAPASTEKIIYEFAGGADGGNPLSDLTLDAAGNLYGTTIVGGTGTACGVGCGTVFELQRTKDGWKEQVLYSFTWGNDGATPEGGVIFDKGGNLYGTTVGGGGSNDSGTIFKLAPNSHGGWTESVLYGFTGGSDGANPMGDLVFDSQGNLYGTAFAGASFRNSCLYEGCGTVFELTPHSGGSWTEATLHVFAGEPDDGGNPPAGVVLDSAGNVYGMTKYGGTASCRPGGSHPGCGTVYRLTLNSGGNWTESVIYKFARGGGFGVNPSGGLIFDNAGHLFGTTGAGGDGFGAVLELREGSQQGWAQNILYRFYGDPDGMAPVGKVELNTDGVLFGVTSRGGGNKDGGTVFELRRLETGWRERILHSFTAGPGDGSNPQAGLISDSHGHLYGTTESGGRSGCYVGSCGTVYEVTP